jgi:hypothetical protein
MVIQCCVCEKIREDGQWAHNPAARLRERVSHSYCPHCLQDTLASIALETGGQAVTASLSAY